MIGVHLFVFREPWAEVNRRWWRWFPPWGSRTFNRIFVVVAGVAFCLWGIFAFVDWRYDF